MHQRPLPWVLTTPSNSPHNPPTAPAIQIHLHRLAAAAKQYPAHITVRRLVDDLVLRPGRDESKVPDAELEAARLVLFWGRLLTFDVGSQGLDGV